MKLAEALLERKSLKEKIESLQARLAENAMVQEGDTPAEEPQALMAELNAAIDELENLVKQINRTNNSAQLPDGKEVIVKLLRPGVQEQIEQDLERDRFMSAEAAVEYGIIDTVLADRTEMQATDKG